MRSGFLVLCGYLALRCALLGQGGVPPSVTSQPVSTSVVVGETATLSATIEGSTPLTFQWSKDGLILAGATNATYFLFAAAFGDQGIYTLVATNAAGSATTLPAAIYVTTRPQTITFPAPPAVAAAGSSLVLNATSSAGLPVTLALVTGSATLTGNVLTSSGGIVVVRASQAGNASIAAAESIDRTITFVAGALSPFLTSPPTDQTVTAGGTATFRAAAIGTPAPTYQWFRDGAAITGATSATLALANTTLADSGRYSVTATNFLGSTTGAATLSVRAAPVFTTAPASQAIFAGDPVSFAAAATGFPFPTFQWRKNGAAIAGATNATLRIASAVGTDAGRFDVIATNALGAVTSTVATLTVTTRDFAGTYLGRIDYSGAANPGEFALLVRPNRRATLLARRTGNGDAVITDLLIDTAGNFSITTGTIGVPPSLSTPINGRIDEVSGEVTGRLIAPAFLDVRLIGTRAAAGNNPRAGFYAGAALGTANGRAFAVVAPDGDTLLVYANTTGVYSARGRLPADGRLVSGIEIPFDVTFNAGMMTGTVRTPPTGTLNLVGSLETLVGGEHIVNLSVRSMTQAAATLITGFVISGTTPKQVLIRAAGPALAQAPFNVLGALADPTLQLFRGNAVVAQNDDWNTPATNAPAISAASARAGAFPFANNSNDAAFLGTLPPGPYTVVIGGGNGIALAEVYEVLEANETAGVRRLVNVSARGLVTPTAPLIAGFVVTGTVPQRVLIRGIGPTLGLPPFNVAGALPNPQLTLFRGSAAVKTNDDWFLDADFNLVRDTAARVGAFALGPLSVDASMLVYLEPGAYTAQVTGPANANATGIALVEVYEATP